MQIQIKPLTWSDALDIQMERLEKEMSIAQKNMRSAIEKSPQDIDSIAADIKFLSEQIEATTLVSIGIRAQLPIETILAQLDRFFPELDPTLLKEPLQADDPLLLLDW